MEEREKTLELRFFNGPAVGARHESAEQAFAVFAGMGADDFDGHVLSARSEAGAASATAGDGSSTATVAETSRSRPMSGSRPLAGSEGSASLASALAAAMNSDGGMVFARLTITPSPRPGNIRALFAWPMR